MNSTKDRLCCPVSWLLIVAVMVLTGGCGGGGAEEAGTSAIRPEEPNYTMARDAGAFDISPSPPDTVGIEWTGEGPGEVRSVPVTEGAGVEPGDTLLLVAGDISAVLLQRLGMELEIASARLSAMPSDSLLAESVDSLTRLLDSLRSIDAQPVLSPLGGTVVRVRIEEGDRIFPEDVLAHLSVPSAGLYIVHPPGECSISIWPSSGDSARFVEERPDHALYSGFSEELEELFGRLAAVQRTALFENDLTSYVITENGDTLPVMRIGVLGDGAVVVLPDRPLAQRLLTWAGETNGGSIEP